MEEIQINLICLAAGYARRFGANKLLVEIDGQPLFTRVLGVMLELKERMEYHVITDVDNCAGDGVKGVLSQVSAINENQEDICANRKIKATILAVTAYDKIADWCAERGISCIRNNPPENTGMASSIKKAIRFLEDEKKRGNTFIEPSSSPEQEKKRCKVPGSTMVFDMYFTADQPNLDADVLYEFTISFLKQSIGQLENAVRDICSIGAMECGGILRNPGIFAAQWRSEFLALAGDEGGKRIRAEHPEEVYPYPVATERMFADIDTPEDVYKFSESKQV